MTIDTSGEYSTGTEPEDIREYLEAYMAEGYPLSHFRLAQCQCGCAGFVLELDDREGVARRTCTDCGARHYVCDSEEFLEDADFVQQDCPVCGATEHNVGSGFSLTEDGEAISWIDIGTRCTACKLLGSPVGWKVGYAPSMHLLDQV
jgi:hypothetical protein